MLPPSTYKKKFPNYLGIFPAHLSMKNETIGSRVAELNRLLVTLFCLAFSTQAKTEGSIFEFAIQADAAPVALNEYARVTGRELLFPFEVISPHRTNAVVGRYDADQALRLMLSNTGLRVTFSDKGNVIVKIDSQQKGGEMKHEKNRKTTTRKPLLKRLGTAIAAALFATSGAGAIAAPGDTNGTEIEEIIVTATYRETDLMDTPQSIGTLSSEMIEALGATDMRGLFQNITGLNMSERELAGGNRYTIRGVSSPTGHEPSAQTSAAVSVYLDDVPMTSAQSPVQQFAATCSIWSV